MEFREVVPSKIQTVLLPTGAIEPHCVANNGADITSPLAISRQITKRLNAMIAPVLPYGTTGSAVYPAPNTWLEKIISTISHFSRISRM